jgi:hypothetical protein
MVYKPKPEVRNELLISSRIRKVLVNKEKNMVMARMGRSEGYRRFPRGTKGMRKIWKSIRKASEHLRTS